VGVDPVVLAREQYRDASNLGARAGLYGRFGVNPQDFQRWAFEQLELGAECRVLELGCGPGLLWARNAERLPAGWQVTLADLSGGMLEEARRNLAGVQPAFRFVQVDAQALPFADARFDTVIANHMLYHVPDLRRALAEVRRVLRPGGVFYAATNGQDHIRELDAAVERVAPSAAPRLTARSFGLENGAAELAPWFEPVELRRYENALVVTEVEALLTYVASYRAEVRSAEVHAALRRLWEEELAAAGAVRVTAETGMFVARARSRAVVA
jgi:SAM-dependent methyltransferase